MRDSSKLNSIHSKHLEVLKMNQHPTERLFSSDGRAVNQTESEQTSEPSGGVKPRVSRRAADITTVTL